MNTHLFTPLVKAVLLAEEKNIRVGRRTMPVGYAEARNLVFHKIDILAASLGVTK